MRFVGVRSRENQAALMRHKAREMLVSQRTQLLNGLRGHLLNEASSVLLLDGGIANSQARIGQIPQRFSFAVVTKEHRGSKPFAGPLARSA
jgi:hypothetical protein